MVIVKLWVLVQFTVKSLPKIHKYFIIKCNKCKSEIKVEPDIYRERKKIVCNNCLNKIFKKFKHS